MSMKTKLLYTIGNLQSEHFKPYGVEAKRQFGSIDLHGPFTTENEANNYMHELIEDTPISGPYVSVTVVKLNTPQEGRRIVRNHGAYEYAV